MATETPIIPPYYGGNQGTLPEQYSYVDPSTLSPTQVMLLVGLSSARNYEELSKVIKDYGQTLTDASTVQKGQAQDMTNKTNTYMKELQAYLDKLNEASNNGMPKWLNVLLIFVIALTQFENPAMMTALIVIGSLQAAGQFDKGGALYDKMVKPISEYFQNKYNMSEANADAIAQTLVIAGLTLGVGAAEGLLANLSKEAAQEAATAAAVAAEKAIGTTLEKELEEAAKEAAETAANRGLTINGVSVFKFGTATSTTLTALVGTMNPVQTVVAPHSEIGGIFAGLGTDILVGGLAYWKGFAESAAGQNFFKKLTQKFKSLESLLPHFQNLLYAGLLASTAMQTTFQVQAGLAEKSAGEMLITLAPLDAAMLRSSETLKVFNSVLSMVTENYQAIVNSRASLPTPDYASAWTAANEVLG